MRAYRTRPCCKSVDRERHRLELGGTSRRGHGCPRAERSNERTTLPNRHFAARLFVPFLHRRRCDRGF